MKVHGDVNARVHIFTATALGRGRVTSPTLGRLYSWGNLIGGWVDLRTSLDTKEWRKISTPSVTQARTRVVQPAAQRLAAWATCPIFNIIVIKSWYSDNHSGDFKIRQNTVLLSLKFCIKNCRAYIVNLQCSVLRYCKYERELLLS